MLYFLADTDESDSGLCDGPGEEMLLQGAVGDVDRPDQFEVAARSVLPGVEADAGVESQSTQGV